MAKAEQRGLDVVLVAIGGLGSKELDKKTTILKSLEELKTLYQALD
jgi:hypothetical protein